MQSPGTGFSAISSGQSMADPSRGTSSGRQEGVVYWMPVISVPFADTMGQVNLAWPPSHQPHGKDLPLSDVNTLRYFFNLGVEYFRIGANMPQEQLPPMTYTPPMQAIQQGGASAFAEAECNQTSFYATTSHPCTPRTETTPTVNSYVRPSVSTQSSQDGGEADPKDSIELSSDAADSGFTSGGEGGQEGEDDGEEEVDLANKAGNSDGGSCQEEDRDIGKQGRAKGRRKYYMYGSHKLIKPIKDIPPRFLSLLADASAARSRCEGQPLYLQQPSGDQATSDPDRLNADAQCFYPAQTYATTTPMNSAGQGTWPTTHLHPPIMIHPPHIVPNAEQPSVGCLAPISAPYSFALPPPSAHQVTTSPSATALPADGRGLPVAHGERLARGIDGNDPNKGQSASMCSYRPTDAVSPVHVSMASLSPGASRVLCAPTNMPPPLAPLPSQTGLLSAGSGKAGLNVCPSHCSPMGSMSLPAHNPAQSHVLYMVSPPRYATAPACTNQQSAVMTPISASQTAPGPPVAVQ